MEFTVQDMTCGHCASVITRAVKQVAPDATVDVDLAAHVVRVAHAANEARVEEAIRDAGYTPVPRQ